MAGAWGGLFLAVVILAARPAPAAVPIYDPLAVNAVGKVAAVDLTVKDTARHRDIPLRVYLPDDKAPAPVLLFSHGLGGSREGSAFLGEHWARRGYVAVFLQHPGSDTSVWRDESAGGRLEAMNEAANGENFLLRVRDVKAVLDGLTAWDGRKEHPLSGRLDMQRVGMSGHSFGAVTTQAVAGQSFGRLGKVFTDRRVKAAVVMSPGSPGRGRSPAQAFGEVRLPWLLMTGTEDVSPIGEADVKSRLAVFPALPPGGKYELVLYGAEHSAFTERALPGDRLKRNPNHHRAILALSTAFWDAWLRQDASARAWLDGEGPRTVLEVDDRWRRK